MAQELPGAGTAASTVFALRGVYHDYWHFRTSVVMLSSRVRRSQAQRVAARGASEPRRARRTGARRDD